MEVELFTLCKFVDNENGKLTIVNTIEDVKASKMPWRAYFGVAIKFKFNEADQVKVQEVKLSISKKGEREPKIFEAKSPIPKIDLNKGNIMSVAGNLKGLIFPEFGDYEFIILQDENLIYSYTFRVVEQKDDF